MSFGFGHLPNRYGDGDVQIFNMPTTNTGLGWHVWRKPPGKTMLDLLLVGGAGGGGGGFSGVAGTARGGGGGGACSGFSRVIIPLLYLPDTLYVQIGGGSQGVTAGQAADGVLSQVTCNPGTTTTTNDTLLVSQNTPPKGGNTGTGAGQANGGTPGTVSAISIQPLASMGVQQFIVGVAGTLGGGAAGAVGPNNPQPTSGVMTWPGAGGAGTTSADFAGGPQTTVGLIAEAIGVGAPAGSNDGASGRLLLPPRYPLTSTAGQGGASSNTGVGGNGGDGGPGSGGGGGGGGTTGGRGGKGGDGFAIFVCW